MVLVQVYQDMARGEQTEEEKQIRKAEAEGNGLDAKVSPAGLEKDSKRARLNEVKFRSRKRSKKVRKRALSDTEPAEKDEGGESELHLSEILLIKEAQKLRERSRQSALDINAVSREADHRSLSERIGSADDDIESGLKSNFAVERSSHAAEERMDKYVEERMQEIYGNRKDEEGQNSSLGRNAEESDIFAIPDRLKVKERPLYDPGEGMPAAGVEEVELPEEARRETIEKTLQAHKELLAKRGKRRDPENTEALPGNFSANFAQHRNDWIAGHLGPGGSEEQGHGGSAGKPARTAHAGQDGEKDGKVEKPRRYQAATDGMVADRFRKRWR